MLVVQKCIFLNTIMHINIVKPNLPQCQQDLIGPYVKHQLAKIHSKIQPQQYALIGLSVNHGGYLKF